MDKYLDLIYSMASGAMPAFDELLRKRGLLPNKKYNYLELGSQIRSGIPGRPEVSIRTMPPENIPYVSGRSPTGTPRYYLPALQQEPEEPLRPPYPPRGTNAALEMARRNRMDTGIEPPFIGPAPAGTFGGPQVILNSPMSAPAMTPEDADLLDRMPNAATQQAFMTAPAFAGWAGPSAALSSLAIP